MGRHDYKYSVGKWDMASASEDPDPGEEEEEEEEQEQESEREGGDEAELFGDDDE
jgi:hypothetical protein